MDLPTTSRTSAAKNRSSADDYGTNCYDFESYGFVAPNLDICNIFSNKKYEILREFVDKESLPRLIRQFSCVESQLPRYNQKKIDTSRRELTIFGEIVDRGVEPIDEKWSDLIPDVVLQNQKENNYLSDKLEPVQRWILTMIFYDYPGIVYCGNGFRLTKTMALGVASRAASLIKVGYSNVYCTFNSQLTVKNAMLFKDSHYHRPFCVIFCSTQETAETINHLLTKLLLQTGVSLDFVKKNYINIVTERNKKNKKRAFGNVVVGTPRSILKYFESLNVPLDRLDSVYVYRAEDFPVESEAEWQLMQAFTHLHSWKSSNFSTFLFYSELVDMPPFFNYFLPKNCSVLNMPKKLLRNVPQVKLCMCEKVDRANLQRKLPWLKAIFTSIQKNTSPSSKKSTLIVATTTNVYFLAGYLNQFSGLEIPIITKFLENVLVERNLVIFKSRSSNFLLIDLPSLTLLEPRYIASVVFYDLPKVKDFLQTMNTVASFSSKQYKNFYFSPQERNIFLLFDPKTDLEHVSVVHKFIGHIKGKVSKAFNELYRSISGLQPISPEEMSAL